MIKVENMKKNFGKKCILKGISFETQGKVIGILGPNGSGKTTLLRGVAGILDLNEGNITFMDPARNIISYKHCKIGYLPQNFGLIKSYTLYEHLEYFACMKNIPIEDWGENIKEVVQMVHLEDILNVKCGKLSGGMIRRVGIAQALLGNPDIILMDEPTVGLDPEERIRFQNVINSSKIQSTILISTHILDDVEEICEELIVLNNGEIFYHGEMSELAALVQNRVFNMTKEESMHWQEYGINIKNYYENDVEMVRFLYLKEGNYNNSKAYKANPKVEDGYIFLLKRCDKK